MFQMPDWNFNEIGDPMGADHKNRVYSGFAELTSDTESEYPGGAGCSLLGDSNDDGSLNILDIVGTVNYILGTGAINSDLCADFNEDGVIKAIELGLFLHERVGIDSEDYQSPRAFRLTSGEGEFIFVNNLKSFFEIAFLLFQILYSSFPEFFFFRIRS